MTRGRQFRKSRQFEIKPKFLIAGDGKNEENYFDGLTCGNPDILIKAVGLGKTGIRVIITKTWSMMKDYEIDPRHGDRVAIVTDLDLRYTPEQVDDMNANVRDWGLNSMSRIPASKSGYSSTSSNSESPAIRRT